MRILDNIKNKLRGEANLEKLKRDGLYIGENFNYGRYCFVDPSFCFLISIGNNVTFSTRVHLLAHDASTKKYINYSKVGKINIEDGCFLGANVTVLPNVNIGKGSIIGAGSVVTKDIPELEVWAGIPAKRICSVKEYIDKICKENYKLFNSHYKIGCGITLEMQHELQREIEEKGWVLVE